MGDIYFGNVAIFYEAEDVMTPGATYRQSEEDIDAKNNFKMLKQHLAKYLSSTSTVPLGCVSEGKDAVGGSQRQVSLDDFFE